MTNENASVITGASMKEAKATGVYRNAQGDQFFWRQGDKIPDGLTLVEPADKSKGAPEKRGEKAG